MELLILLLPLLGSLLLLFAGRAVGTFWGPRLATVLVLVALLLALRSFVSVGLGQEVHLLSLFPWISSSSLQLQWGLQLDGLGSSMLLVVLSIAFFVHLYSLEYMGDDPHLSRFFAYLSLFTFFMLLLVLSPNLVQLFVGWEGVGLCSYLLISFWFTRRQASKAALKAMVVNRVGDGGLLVAMALLYGATGTLDFSSTALLLNHLDPSLHSLSLLTGLFFLLLAFFFKVGLAPLHLWIPDVYDGSPTVAVAYFATAAKGAFALALLRLLYQVFHPLLPFFQGLLLGASLLSILVGTLGALHQHRLKRLIGYSGIVHGGYVGLALSTGSQVGLVAAMAYLAIYLFLSLNLFSLLYPSGRWKGREELRTLGDLATLLRSDPPASVYLALNLFSLAGLPPLAGFFAKLYVLLALVDSGHVLVSVLVLLLSAVSAVYYLRLLKVIYFERPFKWSLHIPGSFSSSLLCSFTSLLNFGALSVQPLLFALLHSALHA